MLGSQNDFPFNRPHLRNNIHNVGVARASKTFPLLHNHPDSRKHPLKHHFQSSNDVCIRKCRSLVGCLLLVLEIPLCSGKQFSQDFQQYVLAR